MAVGDNKNVNTWAGADVLIGGLDAVIPEPGEEFDLADWEFAGTLNGDQGFSGARNSTQTDHFGWGRGIVAQTDKDYKETKTFTSMESTNEVMMRLAWPGSDLDFTAVATGVAKGTLRVPSKEPFKIAFQTERGTVVQRYISANYAQLEGWPVASQNDSGVEQMEVTSVVYPTDGDESDLWIWQRYDTALMTP